MGVSRPSAVNGGKREGEEFFSPRRQQRDHKAADKQVMIPAKKKGFTASPITICWHRPAAAMHKQMEKDRFTNLKGGASSTRKPRQNAMCGRALAR